MIFNHYSKSDPKNQQARTHTHAQKAGRKGAALPGREEDRGAPLSTVHISPHGRTLPSVELWSGGSLITVKRGREIEEGKEIGGKRGKATFSEASRRRLMRMIAKLPRDVLPLFCTLTYSEYTNDPKVWKDHLDTFFKRMAREFPKVYVIWRMEFQKRGAPHFHMLIYGSEYDRMITWIPQNWHEIAGGGDINHLLWHMGALGNGNKPCVEKIRSQKGVMFYCSKYLAKTDQEKFEGVGRWWGVVGRANIVWAIRVVAAVAEADAVELIRLLKRFMRLRGRAKRRAYYSLTAICDADFWLLKLDFLWKPGQFIGAV